MKIIKIYRKSLEFPLQLANGDKYDSLIEVYEKNNRREKLINTTPFVNTDYTEGYNGGMMAEGRYKFICGLHKNSYKALNVVRNDINEDRWNSINDYTKLSYEDRTLPSLLPNPNHGDKKIITYINIHRGGINWDWSHGCITIVSNQYLRNYWNEFIGNFNYGEKGIIELV